MIKEFVPDYVSVGIIHKKKKVVIKMKNNIIVLRSMCACSGCHGDRLSSDWVNSETDWVTFAL